MGIMTRKEKEALNEIFLSLETSSKKYKKTQYFISFFPHHIGLLKQFGINKTAYFEKFRDNGVKNSPFFTKFKKFLSE